MKNDKSNSTKAGICTEAVLINKHCLKMHINVLFGGLNIQLKTKLQ